MNTAQIITVIWAGGLLLFRPSFSAKVMAVNIAATLAICLALDLGAASRTDATMLMMLADLAAGAALIFRAGLARVVGLSFAVTSMLHTLNLAFGVSNSTTFAVLYLMNFVQLGMLSSGGGGGSRIRAMFGRGDFLGGVSPSRRGLGMGSRRVASISEVAGR